MDTLIVVIAQYLLYVLVVIAGLVWLLGSSREKAALTALVYRYRHILGAAVAAGAVLIAWSRVAAHVHHGQDVIAGLVIGVAAGVLAIWLASLLADVLRRRGLTAGAAEARTTADRTHSSR